MRIPTVLAALLFMLAGPLLAADAAPDKATGERILERLQAARPDFEYGAIKETAMPGIYQVQILGGPMLYTDASAAHVVVGELYQVQPGQFVNLVEADRIAVRRERLKTLDRNDLIIFPAKGATKAVINVFTDVDCGYCRKLHQEVPELNRNGVEVRYLAFPRAGEGSPTFDKMVRAWCAADKAKALTDLKNGRNIAGELCKGNPVAAQYKLGQEFDVTGTPSIVLMDGTLLGGYRPVKDMLAILGI
ncbi:MAG: DsbC family protein [Porticoccaceae bacterium]|nr:DsbC family protein [Porticoccaceae bacterium]MEA3299809.1 DsbC family protein [Pseudomonadota bacterium]HLS99594.1 DsbC family protein [Porticoccaceae bacterium]